MMVKVFGKHVAKVVATSTNGKRVQVSGADYSGWVNVGNVKAMA